MRRRGGARRLFGAAAVLFALLRGQEPPAVVNIGITVADLPAATRFYTEVLGFTVLDRDAQQGDDPERELGVFGVHLERARLRLGDEVVELTEFLTPRGRAVPADSRSNDRWFQHIAIVVRDMDQAYAHLRRHRVRHSSPAPQTLPASNKAAGGIRAFYFQDPDGHPLEVLWFPQDKGDRRWQRPGNELFLGIDHTAIVVADTAQSLRFWRDAMGLRIVGTSDNHGIEQARLNNVQGAQLRITTLRGSAGPGVELLEYVTPGGGRSMATDTAANDLWHWTVTMAGVDAAGRGRVAGAGGAMLGASRPGVGDARELWRDADGHRVWLQARAAVR